MLFYKQLGFSPPAVDRFVKILRRWLLIAGDDVTGVSSVGAGDYAADNPLRPAPAARLIPAAREPALGVFPGRITVVMSRPLNPS